MKDTVKIIARDCQGRKIDSGLRVTLTRFRGLSSFWRSLNKAGQYDLDARILRVEGRDIVSEGHAGPGFKEDGCAQDECVRPDGACQYCMARQNGDDEYFTVPFGAYIWSTRGF